MKKRKEAKQDILQFKWFGRFGLMIQGLGALLKRIVFIIIILISHK